jgi:hypothetical protein
MPITDENLDQALQLLGELLATWKHAHFQLVVCGGSALLAQKIISRATHDVDVLAQRNWDQEIFRAHPLPEILAKAAKLVSEELGLEANWLNSAASFHFPDYQALPASFWADLETRDYGDYLNVGFVTRSGQILLKFYAALNRAEARDLDDLKSLAPDSRETEEGLHWLFRSLPGLTHRNRLPDLLIYLGHDELIARFEE